MRQFLPYRQFSKWLLFVLLVCWQTGCVQYQRYPMSKARMPKIDTRDLTFYLIDVAHPLTRVWYIANYEIGEQSMQAFLIRLSETEAAQVSLVRNNRDARNKKNDVLLYAQPKYALSLPDTLTTRVDFSQLEKIEVYETNFGKTIAVSIPGLIGAGLGLTIIALAAKGSCPFVFAHNPDDTPFQGELYSGCTYPQLERHDWLPLPDLVPRDGQYQVRLANQAKEIQHTNLLELVAVDHPAGTEVLFDQSGRLHTWHLPPAESRPAKAGGKCNAGEPYVLPQPQMPLKAVDYDGRDARPALAYADGVLWHGDPNNPRPRAEENITMTFLKPAEAKSGRLVIRAKNTFWMDYLYGLFLDEFGEYSGFVRGQYLKKSAEDIRGWMRAQNIPLSVSVEVTPGRWKAVGSFQLAGPMALKNDVLEIDLSQIPGNTVKIDLESGFMFWEIDWVALDCSEPVPVTVQTVLPATAPSLEGADVAAALSRDDDQYYTQPRIGDEAMVHYPIPPQAPGTVRSLLLHAKGHYEILRDPVPGRPSLLYLRQFERPDALPNYSRLRWQELMQPIPANPL